MKTGVDILGSPKTSPGVQNMKIGPDALGTTQNVSGSAKQENGT
jgi:hypothetical protein